MVKLCEALTAPLWTHERRVATGPEGYLPPNAPQPVADSIAPGVQCASGSGALSRR